MYLSKPGLIIGFHGCDLSVCEKLVAGKITLQASNNAYDWLGNGIYFWENNRQRAFDFARELKERPNGNSKIKTPAVVGAVIDMVFVLICWMRNILTR